MFWFDIPQWIRLLWALLLTGGAAYLLWRVDLGLGVIGLMVAFIFLLLSGGDSSDRRGYKF